MWFLKLGAAKMVPWIKGACCQGWQCEFDPQDSFRMLFELYMCTMAHANAWASCVHTHTHAYRHVVNKM